MSISKVECKEKVKGFYGTITSLPIPRLYIGDSSDVRKTLIQREEDLRSLSEGVISSPPMSYTLRGDVLTISRKSARQEYKDFSFRCSVSSLSEIGTLVEFQNKVFARLYEEGLYILNIEPFNSLLDGVLKLYNAPYKVILTPSVFSDKYVEYIANDLLVLSVDTDSLFNIIGRLSYMGRTVQDLSDDEFSSLSICQSTLEVLYRKSPVITYLLNSGKLGMAKLLKPVYNKTTKQLNTYKSSKGYGYYLQDNIYGVVKRSDYGVHVVLEPTNLLTFEKELGIDLIKEVEE